MAEVVPLYGGEWQDREEVKRQRREAVQLLAQGLGRKLDDAIAQKRPIEERWLKDLRQYHGEYDTATLERIRGNKGSEVFTNLTRPKTNAAEARLAEMLLPTDDRNFAVGPTPVADLPAGLSAQPFSTPNGMAFRSPQDPRRPMSWREAMEIRQAKARDAAEAMEAEIDDQLVEADYHAKAREAIHDACVLGTGILKGPTVWGRTRKRWMKGADGAQRLLLEEDIRPGVRRVSPWDFFPDMAARRIEDAEFVFERRYVSKRRLRELARDEGLGYLAEEIREIVREAPREYCRTTAYLQELRQISGLTGIPDDANYELWEYTGPVDAKTLVACGCPVEGDDPLQETVATVEFVGDRVIRANLLPLESGETDYSVFCYEEDDATVFGYGVPYLIRNPQAVLNAAWRMMMDNSAFAVKPMVVIDRKAVAPADGDPTLTPGKLFYKNDPSVPINQAFFAFSIPSHQVELAAIFQMAGVLIDQESALPMLAQGEKAHAPDTASGMSMLMNAANTQIRRIVKRFDDDVTKPLIGRFYDWNMQYSERQELKGDFEVKARGSSALLVKETQQQGLMQMMQFAGHPVFGPLTKAADLYRKVWQSFHIDPGDVVLSDQEIAQRQGQMQKMQQQAAQQGRGQDPRLAVEQLRQQGRERDRQLQWSIAQMEAQQGLQELALRKDLSLEQVKARLGELAIKMRGDRQRLVEEANAELGAGRAAGWPVRLG